MLHDARPDHHSCYDESSLPSQTAVDIQGICKQSLRSDHKRPSACNCKTYHAAASDHCEQSCRPMQTVLPTIQGRQVLVYVTYYPAANKRCHTTGQ